MLQSSIAWIDFSEHDRRQMMEVVSLFKQRDTRDELGIGSIRDAFADLFFPGTTTLQTRARYFLFVPWLYRDYESRRVPSDRIEHRLKGGEIRLIRALQAAGDTDGMIGKVSGATLHRFPASIYWNGLRRWGILQYSGSQSQYHRWLDHFYRKQRERPVTDDREPVQGWGGGNWDPSLPPIPEHFPDEADFQIRPSEAEYLRERVTLSCHHSLLVTLLDRCEPVDDVAFIWMHPQLGEFPSEQRSWITHARNLSETMQGTALLYNLMLAELCQQDELVATYRTKLEDWREDLASHFSDLLNWDRRAFWELVTRHGRIPIPTRRFVNTSLDILLAGRRAPPNLADHQKARALVRDRETWLKRGRSRFESQRHLEMWSGAAGIAPLEFRWSIARRMTNDILRGLRAGGGDDDAGT